MKNENSNSLDSTNAFFDDYFEKMDLNEDLKQFYEIINDEDTKEKYIKNMNLNKIRNDNHQQFNEIKIIKVQDLPMEFDNIKKDILSLYNEVNKSNILNIDYNESIKVSNIIFQIKSKIEKLDKIVEAILKDITEQNDEMQSKFSISYFKNLKIGKVTKKNVIKKYNDLVLYNTNLTEDIYDDLNIQIKRKKFIVEILELINDNELLKQNITKTKIRKLAICQKANENTKKEFKSIKEEKVSIIETKEKTDKVESNKHLNHQNDESVSLKPKVVEQKPSDVETLEKQIEVLKEHAKTDNVIQDKLEVLIDKYDAKIQNIKNIMLDNSKYEKEFNEFNNFYNKVTDTNNKNNQELEEIYDLLNNDTRIKTLIDHFDEEIIDEFNNRKKIVLTKVNGSDIKEFKIIINSIIINYILILSPEEKIELEEINKMLKIDDFNIDTLKRRINIIVNSIWNKVITKVYSYNQNNNYAFICSNNQFIDERYETVLITKKEVNKVQNYYNYQIGFICGYNDNILYITEEKDVMEEKNKNKLNLKTPIQIENELLKLNIHNRIALDGTKTKIEAVYFINDGNKEKYFKALDLANQYNLPLIVLKKDN